MLSNIYSLSVFASGAALLFMHVLGMVSPFMDKFVAFGESAVMFYLGGPTAVALAKLLLQTTPDAALAGIEARLMEASDSEHVLGRTYLLTILFTDTAESEYYSARSHPFLAKLLWQICWHFGSPNKSRRRRNICIAVRISEAGGPD